MDMDRYCRISYPEAWPGKIKFNIGKDKKNSPIKDGIAITIDILTAISTFCKT
jgi:hypothetical protein